MRRTLTAASGAALAALIAIGVASSAASKPAVTPRDVAQHIAKTKAAKLMTSPAQAALNIIATGDRKLAPPAQADDKVTKGKGGGPPGPKTFTNVRVNDPSLDTQVDQTTQSETTVGVAGSHVAVGYNDSQHTLAFLTAASNLSGYSYSSDGGATFTDGGDVPNAPGLINFGDPWLTSDRDGNMYYATLAFDAFNGALDVGVAKSTNGGRTFSAPAVVSPTDDLFYEGDKDSMAAGPDPTVGSRDDLYVAWDDFFVDQTFTFYTGLPVAHSTDGGQTWQTVYADKFGGDLNGCSFQQYIGATPAVAPDGTLYVAAEKFAVDDPNCEGAPFTASEWIFKSTDGGNTFDAGTKLADVTETGALLLGPGQVMRNLEFPSVAANKNAVYVAWNDAASGNSHIRFARSTNGGANWTLSWATSGSNDEVQPAVSADKGGVHVLYYRRNGDNTLDVYVSNSPSGVSWSSARVTSQSFPGVFTVPQFDPIIALGYMGDYIANASDGTNQYFAWGDNRDRVTNFLWSNGRNDPDVFFAKQ